ANEVGPLDLPTKPSLAALASDAKTLAASLDGDRVRIWDVTTGKFVSRLEGKAPEEALAFSPDGAILAGSSPTKVALWDTRTGASLRGFDVQDGIVPDLSSWGVRHDSALAFSPDGKILASSKAQQGNRLWDVSNKAANRPLNPLVGHKAKVARIAFPPDGRVLASAADDGAIYVWDLSHGDVRWTDSIT